MCMWLDTVCVDRLIITAVRQVNRRGWLDVGEAAPDQFAGDPARQESAPHEVVGAYQRGEHPHFQAENLPKEPRVGK